MLSKLSWLRDCNAQAIGNALHGLGKLAQNNLLAQPWTFDCIPALLSTLPSLHDCKAQEIANALHGLGKLAEKKLLAPRLTFGTILPLLSKLCSLSDCNAQNIANALFGLGQLTQHSPSHEVEITDELRTEVNRLIEKLREVDGIHYNPIAARQVLFGLRSLKSTNINSDSLCYLIKKAVYSSSINPVEAIKAIWLLSIHPEKDLMEEEIQQVFLWLLDSLKRIPVKLGDSLSLRFGSVHKNTIEQIREQLEQKNEILLRAFHECFFEKKVSCQEIHSTRITSSKEETSGTEPNSPHFSEPDTPCSLQSSSASPQAPIRSSALHSSFFTPVFSPSLPSSARRGPVAAQRYPVAPQNPIAFQQPEHNLQRQIFNYIMRDKEIDLKNLLHYSPREDIMSRNRGISTNPPRTQSYDARERAHSSRQRTNQITENDQIITDFFNYIPDDAISQLIIREDISSYLLILLDSCRRHTVYELARTISFRRFYHMPQAELELFIEKLMHPLMLHRDSTALLNAITAISLHPFYFLLPDLQSLQMKLLDEGIQYHRDCNNNKVSLFLEQKKKELEQQTGIITDNPDEENALPVEDLDDIPSSTPQPIYSHSVTAQRPSRSSSFFRVELTENEMELRDEGNRLINRIWRNEPRALQEEREKLKSKRGQELEAYVRDLKTCLDGIRASAPPPVSSHSSLCGNDH